MNQQIPILLVNVIISPHCFICLSIIVFGVSIIVFGVSIIVFGVSIICCVVEITPPI